MIDISVIIPAYNEEACLPETLAAVQRAMAQLDGTAEIVVADNCSTDRTAAIAREYGANVAPTPIKSISAVRNVGAAYARGRYVVFCDADNHIAPNLLQAVKDTMDSGRYVGGGMGNVRMGRLSLGTFLFNQLPLWCSPWFTGVSMVVFYTARETFETLGGFDETILMAEDYDFGKRMRRLGRQRGLAYKHLYRSRVTVSTRKYDEHGDFFLIRHPIKFLRACMKDQQVLDEFWYRPNR